jgi:glycosyltransferase involved in cell wall biosynthesis
VNGNPMSPRRKILFLTSRFPFPTTSGERLRGFQLARLLSRRFSVTVAALAPSDLSCVPAFTEASGCSEVRLVAQSRTERLGGALGAFFEGLPLQVGYFRSRAMREAIAQLAPQHDAVIFHLIRRSEDWRLAPDQPRILEMCDAISENFHQTARDGRWWSPWTWISAVEAPRAARFEREAIEHFDLVTIHTRRDALKVGIPPGKLIVSTQGVDLHAYAFVPSSERSGAGVALVGKMDFYPNRRAALWFAREVLPALPEPIFLKLVGECPPKLKGAFEAIPRVKATGRTPSIAEACADCFAAVAPMHVATGVQNKALEYFAMGLPAVISPSVAEGLAQEPTDFCRVAEEPAMWNDAILSFRAGGPRVEAMTRAARRYVELHHDWDAIGQEYVDALAALLERHPATRASTRAADLA